MIAYPDPSSETSPSANEVSQTASAARKKSLLLIWLSGTYCVAMGSLQFGQIARALYHARDMVSWLLPPGGYVVIFVLPVARIAAGISFIRRSRHSPTFLLALTVYRGVFSFAWYYVWLWWTGKPIPGGPLPADVVSDLAMLAVITRYAFVLRGRGVLN